MANNDTIPSGQSGLLSFTPADAHIQSANSSTNYGSATTLEVDNSPVKHFLFKFDVTGVGSQTITNAKIRLYNTDAASEGGDFYHVSYDSWQEETVTWNNAPTAETNLLASLGSVSANTWYEVDVTSLVTGDGTYSFRISDSVGGADYSSKEGMNDPELELTLGGTPVATNTPTLTPTPGPSSTPTNTSIVTATFTPTPTQILPLFSNADFTYDGDGKRVKSVITTNVGTTTTYFVGAHYEVADGVVTKYYYAGSQRIALRVNGTLNYLLADHLGSTSLTTDASGQIISELRYTAWGEVRYSSGNTATKYQYTGQYSYAGEFGLYFYNARWYDSSLGRFTQVDTIIPDPGNPQVWDRYSYVSNNPLRYIDPTGHKPACGEYGEECGEDELDALTGGGGGNDDGGNDPQDMETSEEGEDFIKWWEMGQEPPRAYPYPDMGGNCTIGYGHLLPNPGREGCSGWPNKTYRDPNLYPNGLTLTGAQDLFDSDIAEFEELINSTITVDLTQAQFDALVSYTFNSGDQTNQPYFEKGIPELINGGDYEGAAAAIASGPITSGHPPQESPRLVERRQAEAALFLYGTYGNYVPWSP